MHFQAACPAVPHFEYVSPTSLRLSPLRRDLTSPEQPFSRTAGCRCPKAPGLGIALNEDLVRKLEVK